MALFSFVTPEAKTLQIASELHLGSRVQFWDAFLFAACLDAGIARLYTEDVPGTPIPGLEIVNPFA